VDRTLSPLEKGGRRHASSSAKRVHSRCACFRSFQTLSRSAFKTSIGSLYLRSGRFFSNQSLSSRGTSEKLLQASTSAFFDVGYSTCLFACSKTPFKTLMDYSLISNTGLCLISLLTLQIAKLHCSNILIVRKEVMSSCFARVQVAMPAYHTQEPIRSKSPINRRNERESRRRVAGEGIKI